MAEGLNPDVWFNNAELVAAKEIGAETVTYVSNIYKSYVSHQMALDNATQKRSKNARFCRVVPQCDLCVLLCSLR